jgi:AcrR family transcriptional regulator
MMPESRDPSMPTKQRPKSRNRLSPEARRHQLMELAAAMVLKQGGLPLSIAELARAAGVSKALFYTYFPTQHDLLNALMVERIAALESAGLRDAALGANFSEAVAAAAEIYFEDVAARGPLLHILLRDRYMAEATAPRVTQFRNRVLGGLARAGRKALRLKAKEAVAAANLILTIPEEAGRLAFEGEMARERARQLSRDLVASALAAIAPGG